MVNTLRYFVFFACVCCSYSAYAQPNIVLIMTDDAGYNDFGFMAALHGTTTDIRTPNLDALASESVILSSGYVTAAVCSPSRAGLLSGQYSQRFGYEDNVGPADGLPAGQQLVSHHLQNLGYTTGAIGKWHLGEQDNVNRPPDMGFDEFYGFLWGGRPYWSGYTGSRAIRRGDTSIENTWATEGDTSRYDPTHGRYLTDAFGEEAADFIDRHAADPNPFFLYVSLNAPHAPLQAKQSDLDMFSDISSSTRRAIAAMTYSVDRAVGDIMNALAANQIDDNTVVVFMNDNGGTSTAPHDNHPFRGSKGSLWEGGIRVPMLVKAPGLAAGVYDEPVVAFDFVPTFVNMAGGDSQQIVTDGVDVMPFLQGESTGSLHEIMFWRGFDGRYAVRKGDWKLTRPGNITYGRLHNLAFDPSENAYYNSQYPHIVTELQRELTSWESQLHKPKWGPLGTTIVMNTFDHFVFRNESATDWSTANGWTQAGTENGVTMMQHDAYANAVLEFGVRNDASYVANNNMTRPSSFEYMLNELRFTGDYLGTENRTGTISGNALLLVDSLEGQPATIRMDATSNSASEFQFEIDVELKLFDNLVFDGDGTQPLVVNGTVRDYHEPRGITKKGESSVVLAGNNHFSGATTVEAGSLSASKLTGSLQVSGGRFEAIGMTTVGGDYTQSGGALGIELGPMSDKLMIGGSASLDGQLELSLADGFAPAIGQAFTILSATERTGTFETVVVPSLDDGSWKVTYTDSSVELRVTLPGDFDVDGAVDAADYVAWRRGSGTSEQLAVWKANFGRTAVTLPGDFSVDGAVDAADYVAWRKGSGTSEQLAAWKANFGRTAVTLPGDFHVDGAVDAADYVAWRKGSGTSEQLAVWKANFGRTADGFGSGIPLPEPSALTLVALSLLLTTSRFRPRGCE